jgi:hypothetical protein
MGTSPFGLSGGTWLIAGAPQDAQLIGLTPGLVGLYQINVASGEVDAASPAFTDGLVCPKPRP